MLTAAESVEAPAVQVQAGPQGKAAVWLDWLTLVQEPPEGAEILRARPPPSPCPTGSRRSSSQLDRRDELAEQPGA